MKKLPFTLLVLVFFGFLFFTQLAFAVVPAPVSLESPGTKVLTGKVKYVYLGDAEKGVMSKIVLVGEKGEISSIEVKFDTVIYDKSEGIITLDKIKKGDKVIVEYIESKKTIEKAESVKLEE